MVEWKMYIYVFCGTISLTIIEIFIKLHANRILYTTDTGIKGEDVLPTSVV